MQADEMEKALLWTVVREIRWNSHSDSRGSHLRTAISTPIAVTRDLAWAPRTPVVSTAIGLTIKLLESERYLGSLLSSAWRAAESGLVAEHITLLLEEVTRYVTSQMKGLVLRNRKTIILFGLLLTSWSNPAGSSWEGKSMASWPYFIILLGALSPWR